jgi:hypothetical protein
VSTDDIKTIWQTQPTEEMTVSLSDLHARTETFRSRVRLRNAVLYVYGLFNIAAGGALVWAGIFPKMAYPMLLMIAAHFFVLWQVATRVTGRELPADLPGQSVVSFLRHEFERQRRALSSAWAWYIVPFMPAFLWELAIWFQAIQAHAGTPAHDAATRMFVATIVAAIVFWSAVWLLFARGANRWKTERDALDSAIAR